jgi:hypothetical protein
MLFILNFEWPFALFVPVATRLNFFISNYLATKLLYFFCKTAESLSIFSVVYFKSMAQNVI